MTDSFTTFTSAVVPLPAENVDTDQIVPARYLKVTDKAGLADALFCDWRFNEDGSLKAPRFVLDRPEMAGRKILLAGDNFGCGSSREHAPQAIQRAGFRAVVAGSFAEIFFANATTLGIVCLALPSDDLAALAASVEADPQAEVRIDVAESWVEVGGRRYAGHLPSTARDVLVRGRYDPLAELLANDAAIATTAAALPYVSEGRR
jgi:3-isopropylmalate/(R)-2-methylmalate dehydratase small subunit